MDVSVVELSVVEDSVVDDSVGVLVGGVDEVLSGGCSVEAHSIATRSRKLSAAS